MRALIILMVIISSNTFASSGKDTEAKLSFRCESEGKSVIAAGNDLLLTRRGLKAEYPILIKVGKRNHLLHLARIGTVDTYCLIKGTEKNVFEAQDQNWSDLSKVSASCVHGYFGFLEGAKFIFKVRKNEVVCTVEEVTYNSPFK